MHHTESKQRSIQQLLQALQTTRDSARVRIHLLSLEAKERVDELEGKLLTLERALQTGSEKATAGAAAAVDELTHAMTELFRGAEGPLSVRVQDVMKESPITCLASDSLSHAAYLMWEHDCGTVPVVDAHGTLVGIVTDRDICMATYTRGQAPASITVEATMSKHVCVVSPADSLEHAARLMGEHQVRRLPVVDGGRLVGMLALADLARHTKTTQGDNLPVCLTLARALAAISEDRRAPAARAAAE
jgi:CBS domain-containing protein